MKVEAIYEEPKTRPIKEVVLRLTPNEARKLADVCGANLSVPEAVAKDSTQRPIREQVERFITGLFYELRDQGIFRDPDWGQP